MGSEGSMAAASTNAAASSGGGSSGLGALMLASQGLSGIMEIFSGFSASRAASTEAELYNKQAQVAENEARRDAAQKKREGYLFREAQAMKFNSSGVTLEGSPLTVLQETERLNREEVDAIMASGRSTADLLRMRGRITQNQGRSSLIGSFAGAALGGLNTFILGKQIGLFGGSGKSSSGTSPSTTSTSTMQIRNGPAPVPRS